MSTFGLDDQEFVVVFEGHDPAEFLDLVQELRYTEASAHTPRDTPAALVREFRTASGSRDTAQVEDGNFIFHDDVNRRPLREEFRPTDKDSFAGHARLS